MAQKWIYRLEELRSKDNDLVGKKCANLGEMVHMGMRVPPGFAISVDGYERFMDETGAGEEIRKYVEDAGESIHKIEKQVEAGRLIRGMIEGKDMPESMKHELYTFYDELCETVGLPDVAVATRSSGSVSMPGQMETYLNVKGKRELLKKIIKVWGSAFTTRAIAFRLEKGMEMSKAPIGVAVLKMVNARSAGVTLTVQPTTGDLTKTVVEGNWGLGESVVSGEITPDSFVVDKASRAIVSSTISNKPRMVVYKKDGIGMVSVPAEMQDKPCIDEKELGEIVRIALDVETYFDMPQDMEWVFDEDMQFPENLFWVQTRPAKYSEKKEDDSEYLAELMTRIFKM
jgi:pyruvate, water dikinase